MEGRAHGFDSRSLISIIPSINQHYLYELRRNGPTTTGLVSQSTSQSVRKSALVSQFVVRQSVLRGIATAVVLSVCPGWLLPARSLDADDAEAPVRFLSASADRQQKRGPPLLTLADHKRETTRPSMMMSEGKKVQIDSPSAGCLRKTSLFGQNPSFTLNFESENF